MLICWDVKTILQVKGVKPEDIALRPDMVLAITAKIEEIPDGIVVQTKIKGKGLFSRSPDSPREIKIDSMSPGMSPFLLSNVTIQSPWHINVLVSNLSWP